MKRLLLILTSIFALVTTSWADQITREQALAKAQQFLNQKGISCSLNVQEAKVPPTTIMFSMQARIRALSS